jgi:CheY-specific phosphatase CheX
MTTLAAVPEILDSCVASALETMCFFGVLGTCAASEPGDELLSARVAFHGDATGVLQLSLSSSAAWIVSANFLGEESHDILIDQVEAVLCELANIICGALLSASDKNGLFHLATPRMQPALEPPQHEASIVTFELETGTLTVQVEFGSIACSEKSEF